MPLIFKRIVHLGWERFIKDKTSSGAALLVVMALIATLTFLFFVGGISRSLISNIQNSVDISAYFKEDAQEDDILKVQSELASMPEVKSADYVSKDEALKEFADLHKSDQQVLDSLQILGTNPFLASLRIRVNNPNQYPKIAEFLGQPSLSDLIEKVDYSERASVIGKISSLTFAVQTGVLGLSAALALIAILVAFNTIRLTIVNSKDEIEIMRLVGASNSFIQGPFLVQGIVVGAISAAAIFVLFVPAVLFLSPQLESILSGFSLSRYFLSNIFLLLLLQFGAGILLGVVSSLIAIRAYLKK